MYNPQAFETRDTKTLAKIMREYPFATVISMSDGVPFVNHLPVTTEVTESGLTLFGHMSKRNPQWQHFKSGHEVTVVFHGPHTYIHPGWYAENDVPTWNYVTVHANGRPRVTEHYDEIVRILKATTGHMEEIGYEG